MSAMLAHIGDGISTGKNAKMEVCQRGKEQVRAWKGWTKYALQQEGKRGGGPFKRKMCVYEYWQERWPRISSICRKQETQL